MKWRAPSSHRFGRGWILGTLNGEPAFSDGHAMFIGKRKGSPHTVADAFEKALAGIQIKTGRRLTLKSREMAGAIPCVRLGTFKIQEMYYDAARRLFKRVEFIAGRKGQAVICKQDGKVVGAIMGMRY